MNHRSSALACRLSSVDSINEFEGLMVRYIPKPWVLVIIRKPVVMLLGLFGHVE